METPKFRHISRKWGNSFIFESRVLCVSLCAYRFPPSPPINFPPQPLISGSVCLRRGRGAPRLSNPSPCARISRIIKQAKRGGGRTLSILSSCRAADRSRRGKSCSSFCCCCNLGGGGNFHFPLHSFFVGDKGNTLSQKGCEKAKKILKLLQVV